MIEHIGMKLLELGRMQLPESSSMQQSLLPSRLFDKDVTMPEETLDEVVPPRRDIVASLVLVHHPQHALDVQQQALGLVQLGLFPLPPLLEAAQFLVQFRDPASGVLKLSLLLRPWWWRRRGWRGLRGTIRATRP